MATHTFDTRSSEWLGDMTVWLRDNANISTPADDSSSSSFGS